MHDRTSGLQQFQDWCDLLFLHWRVPAAELAGLVHPRLSIDEFEGSAWVSMTPFTLRKGRFRGLPPLPDFHELNFRTYVTHPRHGPGIWFFSLDAANALAVAIARLSVRLPYFPARMDRGEGWYRSERLLKRGRFEVRFSTGPERGCAAPGSLEEFLIATAVVLAWAATGPLFHFSDSWQLVINTGTTIVTFLMVFLIQATQNRDSKAVQLKLDELIRAQREARNVFADLEHATEEELEEFEQEFKALRARGISQKQAARVAAEKAAKT